MPDDRFSFRDQVVVDLGAGFEPHGYLLARDLGARAYVAVDFAHAATLARNISELPPADRTIPFAVIYDNLTRVLPHLPPRSCSFLAFGIDDTFADYQDSEAAMTTYLPDALHPSGGALIMAALIGGRKIEIPASQNRSALGSIGFWTVSDKLSTE